MHLLTTIQSNVSDATKFVFLTYENLAVEATYINKHDNKHIICLPSQTSCSMGCQFCHITDIASQIVNRNLSAIELFEMASIIYKELSLETNPQTLLISIMGCGEPLANTDNLILFMYLLRLSVIRENFKVSKLRFAVATSMPKAYLKEFEQFVEKVKQHNLDVKLHLSLHYTDSEVRKAWMPTSISVEDSIDLLDYYKRETKCPTEIHYALIAGVNDTLTDCNALKDLVVGLDIPIKFLAFNEKSTLTAKRSTLDVYEQFKDVLEKCGITTEYYIPPAQDIGGSCGQLLKDYYLKYNLK